MECGSSYLCSYAYLYLCIMIIYIYIEDQCIQASHLTNVWGICKPPNPHTPGQFVALFMLRGTWSQDLPQTRVGIDHQLTPQGYHDVVYVLQNNAGGFKSWKQIKDIGIAVLLLICGNRPLMFFPKKVVRFLPLNFGVSCMLKLEMGSNHKNNFRPRWVDAGGLQPKLESNPYFQTCHKYRWWFQIYHIFISFKCAAVFNGKSLLKSH